MADFVGLISSDVRLLTLCVVALVGTIAGISDLRSLKVSNLLTIPLTVCGVIFHVFSPIGLGVLYTLAGTLIGFALLLPGFLLNGVGAGDVKLLAAIGAWLGATGVCLLMILAGTLTILCAFILSNSWKDWRKLTSSVVNFRRTAAESPYSPKRRDTTKVVATGDRRESRRQLIPMATMMAVATWILLFLRLWAR